MATADVIDMKSLRPGLVIPIALAGILFLAGAGGAIGAAWGYGLFLIATLLLLSGILFFAIFTLTRVFETDGLRRVFGAAFWLGAWTYVLAVAALGGHFLNETLHGRMELKWILFGPAALAALVVLDYGLYRILVAKNAPTWRRYGHVVSRESIEPAALRKTLIDEVVLHRTLLSQSPFRWVRHQLIFWGFALMFATEIAAVFLREAMPSFGLPNIWHDQSHPVRLAFDFSYDITGFMVMIGCIMALIYRVRVNGTPDQKYTDTPTAVFLLVVVVTGFLVEGVRIAQGGNPAASPIGAVFALLIPDAFAESAVATEINWLFHVLLSCAFIAYVPVKRLVHSCATPMGRLMNSQKGMLAAKKAHSIKGLFGGNRTD